MKTILIAEDNISHLLILKKILVQHGYSVLSARNGVEALAILRQHAVDCVLTDWMMPEMNGLELIRHTRGTIRPGPAIIVITALVSEDACWKAISSGADDYLSKPYDSRAILQAVERVFFAKDHPSSVVPALGRQFRQERPAFVGIAVAASTGGPETLLNFFDVLPFLPTAAIFVVLHGPEWMLKTMIAHIQKKTTMTVRLAVDGMCTKAGEIYLAPGNRHMVVEEDTLKLRLNDDPPENFVKPAADPLFRSVAIAFGKYSIGIVMTGMGRDGSVGCGYISASGGTVIVQDPHTAIIDSMPQSVLSLGLANTVAAIVAMPSAIARALSSMNER